MDFPANLKKLEDRVGQALRRSGRPQGSVAVLAVSKSADAEAVRAVRKLGVLCFGENRWQEARPKIERLAGGGIEWHFIGRLQTNKLPRILDDFAVVQSFDRIDHLEKADAHLAGRETAKTVFLQVNISGEPQKGGFAPEDVRRFFGEGGPGRLRRLRITGLMGIGPAAPGEAAVRGAFRNFRKLYDQMKAVHPGLETLSMGMSGDFEAAIEEGSTMIRVGTAIFGERD